MSEQTAIEVACGISEIRMIEEVKNLGSELKIEAFIQGQAATQTEIYLKERKPPQGITS